MKANDIDTVAVLKFLARPEHQGHWCVWGQGYGYMPTVQDAMPPNTPPKLQLAKMRMLLRRGLVDGCGCGCRGDWAITDEGLALIGVERTEYAP